MKKLLLHYRADCNTNDIWKAAINAGWSTDRIHDHNVQQAIGDSAHVRYYGNTLQGERIADKLPFIFHPLDPRVLSLSRLTKRSIQLMRLRDLGPIDRTLFIKPVYQKYFEAGIYKPGEKIECGSLPDDLIYVQEVVEIINEVRCFVLDGKIHTASYYRVSGDYYPANLDDGRASIIDDMVKELAPCYPPGVVLDFGYTSKREWLFIEPNEAWASGIYDCDPVKCLDVIEASQFTAPPPSTPKPSASESTPESPSGSASAAQ